ncbi:MAG: hypothetical protein GWN76_23285 [candidate division Zixibacteria bacterium]|nr:hypothetical protein [candidate division Zixibacteria bacterium]
MMNRLLAPNGRRQLSDERFSRLNPIHTNRLSPDGRYFILGKRIKKLLRLLLNHEGASSMLLS